MEKKPKHRSLRLLVQQIQEAGEDYSVQLTDAEQADILAGAEGGYRSTGEGAVARLHLSRAGGNVFVRGEVTTEVVFTCSRCLAEKTEDVAVQLQWTFLPVARYRTAAAHGAEVELKPDDLDVSYYSGEEIDLQEVIREAILLELRPYPTCTEECSAGPVEGVGEQAAEEQAEVDPRWAPLLELQKKKRS